MPLTASVQETGIHRSPAKPNCHVGTVWSGGLTGLLCAHCLLRAGVHTCTSGLCTGPCPSGNALSTVRVAPYLSQFSARPPPTTIALVTSPPAHTTPCSFTTLLLYCLHSLCCQVVFHGYLFIVPTTINSVRA